MRDCRGEFGVTEGLLILGLVVLMGMGMVLDSLGVFRAQESEPKQEVVKQEKVMEEKVPVGQVAGQVQVAELPEEDQVASVIYRPISKSASSTPRPAPSDEMVAACMGAEKPVWWFGGVQCYANSGLRQILDKKGGDREEAYRSYIVDKMDPGVSDRLIRVCATLGVATFNTCTEKIRTNLERFQQEIFTRDKIAWAECDYLIAVGDQEEKARNQEMFWRARMTPALEQMYLYCEQNGGEMGSFEFR